jgi:hypothetical protein
MCSAAAAKSIDYDTGIFEHGTLLGTFTTSISADITGSLHQIDLSTGTLTKETSCVAGATCYDFSAGSIKVSLDGKTVFSDSLTGGVTIKTNGSASIEAVLAPESGLHSGTATASFSFSGKKITAGSENAVLNTTVIPEPGALFLLGSGLVGLWWIGREKLMSVKPNQ